LGSQMLLHIGTCHLTFEPHESVLVRWVFCTSLQLWNWVMTPVEMCVSFTLLILAAANFFLVSGSTAATTCSNPRFLVMQCRLGKQVQKRLCVGGWKCF